MSEDWAQCKDSFMAEGTGNTASASNKWSWKEYQENGAIPDDCVDVQEGNNGNLLVCLVRDSSQQWFVGVHDPNTTNRTATSSGTTKFLVVKGGTTWKKLKPTDFVLPEGAISGGTEHYGEFGRIFVGRHSRTHLVGTIFALDNNSWCFSTFMDPSTRVKDDLEMLCADQVGFT